MAYERVTGPLGPERRDVLNAILAATVANSNRGKGKRAREPRDFLPTWDQDARREAADWTDMLAAARSLTRRLGGTDETGGGDHGRDDDRRS